MRVDGDVDVKLKFARLPMHARARARVALVLVVTFMRNWNSSFFKRFEYRCRLHDQLTFRNNFENWKMLLVNYNDHESRG